MDWRAGSIFRRPLLSSDISFVVIHKLAKRPLSGRHSSSSKLVNNCAAGHNVVGGRPALARSRSLAQGLLHFGRELNAMDQVIGIMFVIVVIGLLVDKILFSPWETFLHRRWGTAGT